MDVKVLGPGCANCVKLYETTKQAVTSSGLEATVTKVEDYREMMSYGVMMTPALVIDGEVKSQGRVPETGEIVSWLMTVVAGGQE